jgi:cell division transport system permease protein
MVGSSTAARAWRGGKNDWRLHALSVFSTSVAFVCLASALLVVVNLEALQARWARAGRASVYLRDGAPEEDVSALRRALGQTPGVTIARYVSSADARREIVGDTTEGSLAALPAEAFPASIEVELAATVTDEDLAGVATKLRALPSVESVETYQRWTDRLAALLKGGVTAGALLAAVVLGAVVSVVASTMRLALQRRQIEVEVLKLVGATDGYVRGPFVLEGAMQGAVGASAAMSLLGVLFLIVRQRFDGDLATLVGVTPVFLPWSVVLGMIALGATLGALAAFAGVRRLSAV